MEASCGGDEAALGELREAVRRFAVAMPCETGAGTSGIPRMPIGRELLR